MTQTDDSLRRRQTAYAVVLLLLVVSAVWLGCLWGDFVYDDNLLIKRNPALERLSNLPSVLGSGMWSFLDAEDARHLGYWRPLAGVVLLFTNVIGHGSPLVFHGVALGLHLAATLMALLLARELTRSLPMALFVALLFGLHPVHVESVAWISALNDPLFAVFAFATLLAWARWRARGSAGTPWAAGVCFLLALASKELALATLPLLLGYDLLRARQPGEGERWWSGVASGGSRGWLPIVLALAAWYLARVAVFGELAAGFGRTTTHFGVGWQRLAQLRLELLGGYTWLAVWPLELKFFHPFRPEVSGSDPQFLRELACAALLLLALALALRRRAGTLAFALAFLPLAISPALLRVESLGISPLAERYLYLGVFGFVLALVWSAWTFLPRALAVAVCVLVSALYAVRTVERIGFWRDEPTLFRRALVESPSVPHTYWGRGRILLESYRRTGSATELREAMQVFFDGLDLLLRAQRGDSSIFATQNDHVQTNLGVAWCLLYEAEATGQASDKAPYDAFKQVAERYPENEQALVGLAAAALVAGRSSEAEIALRKALAQNDRNVEAHHNLGIVLLSRGDFMGAAASLRSALALRPGHLEDQILLARIALQQGNEAEARAWTAAARASSPEATAPLVVEATLEAQRSNLDAAQRLVGEALERNPDDGEALALKAKLHLARGEKNGAAQALTRACELLPTNFEVHYNLGALMLERSMEGALPYLLRAYGMRGPGSAGDTLRSTLLGMPFRSARAPCELAQADMARGDLAGAAEWAAKALAIEPESGEVHLLAGNLHIARNELDAAEREWRRAAELLPDSLEARLVLGRHLKQYGRGAEARPYLEQILEIAARKGTPRIEDELTRRSAGEMLEELRRAAPGN